MMEEEILPRTSSEVKLDNNPLKRKCTHEEKEYVAENIKSSECRSFGRSLGLRDSQIDEIETDCKGGNLGFRETVYQMLVKWEQIKGREATVQGLIEALHSIDRNDIVHYLISGDSLGNRQPSNDLLNRIQREQEKKYGNLMLPRTLWLTKKRFPLEEMFIELTMKKKDKWGQEIDTEIRREEIFDKIEVEENTGDRNETKEPPRRILVEGHPGYGKTTLVTKLLFDWSREENYIREKFDLVFVIALRNFKGDLENLLLQQIKDVDGSDDEKLREIKRIEGRVLLLLDGLDECSERVKENLLAFFKGDQYPNMTVLVTCRTGFFQFEDKSDDHFDVMGNTGFQHHLVWGKRIQIKGISKERRIAFLQKYLKPKLDDLKALVYTLYRCIFELNFYECPLFLLLLVVFVQKEGIESIQSRTKLFKRISNFVLSRNLNRENLVKEEIDVFIEGTRDNLRYRKLLLNFGQLCLEKLKKQNLVFEESELLECSGGDEIILKLGFISKDLLFANDEEAEHYEPIHKTFMEFLAAFYLSSLGEAELEKEIKELTLKCDIWPKKDQPLYSFLGGLLQENAYKLLNMFSSLTCFISVFNDFDRNYHLEGILEEIPTNDKIYESLVPFLSSTSIPLDYMSPVLCGLFAGLLDFMHRRKIPNNIIIPANNDVFNSLPENVEFDTLLVGMNRYEHHVNRKRIICKNLRIFCTKDDSVTLKEILSKIKAEKIYLSFHCISKKEIAVFTGLFEEIQRKKLKTSGFYHLDFYIKDSSTFSEISPLIEEVLRSKTVKFGLSIEFKRCSWNVEEINSLLDSVFKSHLRALFLEYEGDNPITLTVDDKEWESLRLSGNFQNISTEENQSLKVEHLDIRSLKLHENNWDWLMKCSGLKRLHCDLATFFKLVNFVKMDEWKGFDTVEYLDISEAVFRDGPEYYVKNVSKTKIYPFIFTDDLDKILSFMKSFKNLREIQTLLHESEEYLVKLISVVPILKKICIYNGDWRSIKLALDCLERELPIRDEKLEVEVLFHGTEEALIVSLNKFYELMEKCCLKNVLFSCTFLWHIHCFEETKVVIGLSRIRDKICKYFLCRENFKISYTTEVLNCPSDDPMIKSKCSISYERE